ncbi:MAG: HIT domain-containing protein [candidate division Zixibacteria bacterium]|nr:HIT domain-containing protein [Candidatus Tariuqbacter arcticus]
MKKLWAPWRMEYIQDSVIPGGKECIFCIGNNSANDRERLILHRGETAFVMMNKYPYNNGHLLIAPYRHIADFNGLTDEEFLEIQQLLGVCIEAMKGCMHPHGFNIGMNLGQVAGAGVEDHIHYHILPRWSGDTNFLPVFGEVKVISEALEATYDKLKEQLVKLMQEAG